MKIRTKITVLAGAAILFPLLGGIYYVRTVGQRHFERQVGMLYLTIANEMAEDLEYDVLGHMTMLNNWVREPDFLALLEKAQGTEPDPGEIARIEEVWSSLDDEDELIAGILNNTLAGRLNTLGRIDPAFAELILTDRHGRLVASSNRTSDYWQADESWWRHTAGQGSHRLQWPHNIQYDASAGVQVMDVMIPLYSGNNEFLGVIKGSLNAIEVLQGLAPDPWNAEIIRDIFYADGTLFTRLNASGIDSEVSVQASADSLGLLVANRDHWQVVDLFPEEDTLAACVPLAWKGGGEHAVSEAEEQIYVVVHRKHAEAMGPIQSVINTMTVRGVSVVAVLVLISYFVATFWFVRPLRRLHRAAMAISDHVRMREQGRDSDVHESLRQVAGSLHQLQGIKTRDELEELASIFSHMGSRVINFHRQLERELARKTEEINEDLAMAREFQEALLPAEYPSVSYPVKGALFNLGFSHVYRPAQSVGGDFFDVMEIPNRCIRVLVADVMGHGARSALMTAILHSLVYGAAKEENDPAHLLNQMNEEFHAIGQRTGEMVFVTAVHMIFDLHRGSVRYAVAGHPSPLVVERNSGKVRKVVPPDYNSPAAGLFEDSSYQAFEFPLEVEQSVLLYTDGALEVMNPHQEEFGMDRMILALRDWNDLTERCALPNFLIDLLDSHMNTVPSADDICLLSVDISKVP